MNEISINNIPQQTFKPFAPMSLPQEAEKRAVVPSQGVENEKSEPSEPEKSSFSSGKLGLALAGLAILGAGIYLYRRKRKPNVNVDAPKVPDVPSLKKPLGEAASDSVNKETVKPLANQEPEVNVPNPTKNVETGASEQKPLIKAEKSSVAEGKTAGAASGETPSPVKINEEPAAAKGAEEAKIPNEIEIKSKIVNGKHVDITRKNGKLLKVEVKDPETNTFLTTDYNELGKPTKILSTDGTEMIETTYKYDKQGRLIKKYIAVDKEEQIGKKMKKLRVQSQELLYTYDANGQRQVEDKGVWTF